MGSKARFVLAEKSGSRKTVFTMVPNALYFSNLKLHNSNDGMFSHVPGGKYKGEWERNKKHGFGTQTYTRGDVYEGEWKMDKREGKGTYYKWSKGKNAKSDDKKAGKLTKSYAGDWVADMREGRGVGLDKEGRYEGLWAANKKHGTGKMVYNSGEVYEGSWKEGKRSGMGVLTYDNGDKYEGHFANDVKEGPGRFYYYSTSKIYEGEWVGGTPQCGEFRSLGPNELVERRGDVETFNLPSLTLKDSQRVLSEAISEIRQDRAAASNEGATKFNTDDLEQIKMAFNAFADEEGLVSVRMLGELVASLGIGLEEDQMAVLLEHLGAEESDDVSYAEFVDIVVVISGGM
jgi:hypothetical protein